MKIGLVGAENSHTLQFCEALNVRHIAEGIRVTHVYGDDSPENAAKMAKDFGLAICESEEELLAACDAVVVTYRCGTRHFEPVMRALRAGKAVFNDKPFAMTVADAEALAAYAQENGVLLTGGSGSKLMEDIAATRAKLGAGSAAMISFGADPNSPYDGFWFYGVHSAEMCIALFGEDYKSVTAVRHGKTLTATVSYGDRQCVIVTQPDVYDWRITTAVDGAAEQVDLSHEGSFLSVRDFASMLQTGKTVYPLSHYVAATRLMQDIMASAGI